MIIDPTLRFKKRLQKFPLGVREKFYKQAEFLCRDIRYPSLRAKKYDEAKGVWQARVDDSIRFYFIIEGDAYVLLDIRIHFD